tara:strand:- start:207 stop:2135 length:1929 start_codon:yes stop_codon:yes gene_type:complete
MKKTTTIIASLLITVGMTAQINPLQVASHLNKAENKIIRSGNEVFGNLIVNPNPNTSAVLNSKSAITEEVIGTTTYDLQSNAAVQNRILVHDDGTISAAWTMSQELNSVWSDRGTGYNFFDGTAWGAQPTIRLEASRGGWPSILKMGSGKEASITHNTDNGYVNMTHRATTGSGAWTESIISSQDSSGVYRDMIWNRTVVGGINNESLHMVAVTASSNFGGAPFNGLDGALVYYRSQDEGVTWDRKDMQLPGLDTSYYISHSGDSYAIAAKGNTIAVAYFAGFSDAILIKSTDNGDTWTKTIFSNFPVDKYFPDTGLDMDADGFADTVYTTDGSGALLLDDNGMAHVFYGNMRVTDGDLTDGFTSYFPGTNGLIYWNESLGEDTSGVWVTPSLWDHGNGIVIAGAEDTDGDGTLNLIDWGSYGGGISSMPNAGMDANGVIFVSYSAVMENIDNGSQNFRHINIIKSIDGGATWSNSVDVTPHDGTDGGIDWAGMQECVFGSMNPIVDDKIRIVYQKDFEPGTALGADEDFVDFNDIIYLEIDTVGLFDSPLAITEINNSTNFSVYPNPATHFTTLKISSDKTQIIKISVVDLLGKEITKKEKVIFSGINTETIDVSEYQNGIYFVNLQIGAQVTTKKLVITN